MKYRIEPKPEGRNRYKPYLETDDLAAVREWIRHPPVPVTTRIRGTDGTYHQLATPSYHDIIVSEYAADATAMDDNDNIPHRWMPSIAVDTTASMESEEGCRQIEVWQGKPAGSLRPRKAYDN